MKMPYLVSRKKKVKASKGRVDPIQVNLFGRRSICGLKCSLKVSRTRELMPSDADDEIGVAQFSFDVGNLVLEFQLDAERLRALMQQLSSVAREQPQKPLPPMRRTVPLKWISMSSQ